MLVRLRSNIAARGLAQQFPSENVKGNRLLGRCRLGTEDNTKIDLNRYERVDCIHLTGEGTVAGLCELGYE
jgi:hypothetical protein